MKIKHCYLKQVVTLISDTLPDAVSALEKINIISETCRSPQIYQIHLFISLLGQRIRMSSHSLGRDNGIYLQFTQGYVNSLVPFPVNQRDLDCLDIKDSRGWELKIQRPATLVKWLRTNALSILGNPFQSKTN